jgi:outer membrane protein
MSTPSGGMPYTIALVAILGAPIAQAVDEPPVVQADVQPRPLWEFGLGVGAVSFGDYRGADTTHVYVLPVPYFVYRGKFLQADRNGIRGLLFNQEWLELNISVNATTPVRANAARAGMPDLRSTLEIGPSVDLHLWHSNDSKVKFDVRLPIRTVFTVQSSPRSLGWLFAPNASVDVKDVGGFTGWNFGALAGPLFAARRYDDYFYTVTNQYATPERPAYEAPGGYAGTQVLAALSKRYPSFWVGAYVRHDSLGGAVFQSSPLVKRNEYWAGGFGIAWMITQSSTMVEADE